MTDTLRNIIIVGTGPAGLTAAIYTARAGLKPLVLAGPQHGGQLTITTDVENFPGFRDGIMGPQLMQDMTAQAERFGVEIVYEKVTQVDFASPIRKLTTAEGKEIKAHSIIISTGATARTLGLKNESQLMGRGLSTCATCDGFFVKGKTVAVIGGGDSAMEEALYLSKICAKVLLIHRRDTFRASNIMQERARKAENIEILTPFNITELVSHEGLLTGAKLQNIDSKETREITVDGLFYAVGHIPNSKVFLPYVKVDDNGYIKVTNFTQTDTPGVFAAGDIADPHFKQAVTAAGMGCQAAIQAQHYLENTLN